MRKYLLPLIASTLVALVAPYIFTLAIVIWPLTDGFEGGKAAASLYWQMFSLSAAFLLEEYPFMWIGLAIFVLIGVVFLQNRRAPLPSWLVFGAIAVGGSFVLFFKLVYANPSGDIGIGFRPFDLAFLGSIVSTMGAMLGVVQWAVILKIPR